MRTCTHARVLHTYPINALLPLITFYVRIVFSYFFHFHRTVTLLWACGSLHEPWNYFSNSILCIHALVLVAN